MKIVTMEQGAMRKPTQAFAGHSVMRYGCAGLLGKCELEESLMRVLWPSIEQDIWVGHTWKGVFGQMLEEHSQDKASSDARRYNVYLEDEIQRLLSKYRLACVLTLGVWALVATKPIKGAMKSEPTVEPVLTCVHFMGPEVIVKGIHELIKRGFLRVERQGEDDVLFPTPLLEEFLLTRG